MDDNSKVSGPADGPIQDGKPEWRSPKLTELPISETLFGGITGGDGTHAATVS